MNLIALLVALALERLATHWLHLREPHWFARYFEWALGRFGGLHGARVVIVALIFTLLPVLPVIAVSIAFSGGLAGLIYIAFAALVLVLSLGPRDLKEETDEYCAALTRGDAATAASAARALMEHDARQRLGAAPASVEDAIFVQANNRIFGVTFWFLVSGPAGAWLFRVSDLMRRQAVMEHRELIEHAAHDFDFVHALQAIHGVLAWLPARLLAIGYALAGSFDAAFASWRALMGHRLSGFFEDNDVLLVHVGRGALAGGETAASDLEHCRAALRLVWRSFLIWLVVVSVLVLVGRIV